MKKLHKGTKLALSLIIPQVAGFLGSLFTTPAIPTWYATIPKPSFTPPSWVFAPVWTTLFVLMGIALFLVWSHEPKEGEKKKKELKRSGITLFGIQLGLNVLWSILFFGLHSPKSAFFEIMILWIAIGATIVEFYKTSKTAAWLLVPYIAWVGYAALLTYSFWKI